MTPGETTYGRIAVIAAKKAADGIDARLAWEVTADTILAQSPTAAHKSCPKAAFLGLVHAGQIAGVPRDASEVPGTNGEYALVALDLLRQAASDLSNPSALWRQVMIIQGVQKKHNKQMHVVMALWNEGLLVTQRI